MINRRVATVIAVGALTCAVGLGVFLVAAWRVQERRAQQRDEERDARLNAEWQALRLGPGGVLAAPHIDWDAVGSAYRDPRAPAPDGADEFAPLFESLGRALDRDDAEAAGRLCDSDRLIDELIRAGPEVGVLGRTRADVEADFRDGFGPHLVRNRSLRWQRTDVRRIDWLEDRSEAVLYVVHRHAGESFKALWWVVKREGTWKVYDTADVFLASRYTRRAVSADRAEVAIANADDPNKYAEARGALATATRLLNTAEDADQADRALGPARGLILIPEDAAVRAVLEGRILAHRGDVDGALDKFDEAQLVLPDMPAALWFRARACTEAGRFADALEAIREYQNRIGPDADGLETEGHALEGLARRAEAADAYRKALDDDADHLEALAGLARVLPDGQKREVVDRLAKATEPRKAYDVLVSQAVLGNDKAAADLLLNTLRKLKPDDPRGLADDVRRKVKADKFAEALDLLKRGLKAKEERDRDWVLYAYLHAMNGADKPLEAYAAVPAAHAARAFRALAEDLDDEIAREGGEAAKHLRQLTDLVAAHRKQVPNDPWAWFYEAEVCWHAKEYAKAEELLAAGAAKLPPHKPGPDDPTGRDWDAEQFRERRVECLFKLKKGRVAYTDLGPVELTFRQLASLYDGENDLKGLGELLAWHRERVPDDPEIVYWQAHLHFRRDNLAVAIPLYKSYLRDAGGKGVRTWPARDELIRSLARTKPADAVRMVRDLGAEQVNAALRAAVAAAAGDREELERLLAESARAGKTWFYADPDFRRFIDQEKYRDLRAKYPDPNPPPKTNG